MNTVSLFIFLCSFFLIFFLVLIGKVVSLKFRSREKSSPLECGLDPLKSARLPFSMRFLLLAMVLLVFDIELAVLMVSPVVVSPMKMEAVCGLTILVGVLMGGLLYEWKQGSLDWK